MALYGGTVTNLDDSDMRIYECNWDLKAVGLSDSEVWAVWDEDGQKNECTLKRVEIEGIECWVGPLQCSGIDDTEGEVLAMRYDLLQGGAALIAEWKFGDKEGKYLIDVEPKPAKA